MAGCKNLISGVILTALVCGRVLVTALPQAPSSNPNSASSKSDEPLVNGVAIGKTKGFEFKHGYKFNLANSPDGSPFTTGWAYVGARAGPGPEYYTDDTAFLPSDLWSGKVIDIATASSYVVAATLALCSLYYTFGPLFHKGVHSKKPTAVGKPATSGNSPNSTDQDASKEDKKVPSKSRRRRGLQVRKIQNQTDADLTRLASIVLNAIASGECLQKTICQLGTQIGESPKGRLAFSLIDTLLPPSVHNNQYFITMKKALKGESICDRFNCQYRA